MEVSKQLRKQIIVEIIVLAFLVCVIIYAIFAINKSNQNKVHSEDGMVIVLDDSRYHGLEISSDGEGLSKEGISYTITNNNDYTVNYKVKLVPTTKRIDILNYIRVGLDDLYTYNLTDLEKDEDGYILTTFKLLPGHTKIHLIKYWYKLDLKEANFVDKNIQFEYHLIKEKVLE